MTQENRIIRIDSENILTIPGNGFRGYKEVIEKCPTAEMAYYRFKHELETMSCASFQVPCFDPSINQNDQLCFEASLNPATGYSYRELVEIAKKNNVRLGTKRQYIQFLAYLIYAGEWTYDIKQRFADICLNSSAIGHYAASLRELRKTADSSRDQKQLYKTGTKPIQVRVEDEHGNSKIIQKADLANTIKILDGSSDSLFYFAGGAFNQRGYVSPLATIDQSNKTNIHFKNAVGWFVL